MVNEHVCICIRVIRRINSRIMYAGICIKKEFWTVIVVYALGMERLEEERDVFWEELKRCIDAYEDRGKVLIIGDMNVRVGDSEVEGVVGKFGVSGVYENGRKLMRVVYRKQTKCGENIFCERGYPKVYTGKWSG